MQLRIVAKKGILDAFSKIIYENGGVLHFIRKLISPENNEPSDHASNSRKQVLDLLFSLPLSFSCPILSLSKDNFLPNQRWFE
jgi:hypothetical protein